MSKAPDLDPEVADRLSRGTVLLRSLIVDEIPEIRSAVLAAARQARLPDALERTDVTIHGGAPPRLEQFVQVVSADEFFVEPHTCGYLVKSARRKEFSKRCGGPPMVSGVYTGPRGLVLGEPEEMAAVLAAIEYLKSKDTQWYTDGNGKRRINGR